MTGCDGDQEACFCLARFFSLACLCRASSFSRSTLETFSTRFSALLSRSAGVSPGTLGAAGSGLMRAL